MKQVTRSGRAAMILVVAALIGAACGSSSHKASSNNGAGPAPSTTAGATNIAATRTPIVLGYYNQENSTTLNFPEYTVATEAAVSYINKELGGVNGHPIELHVCKTAGTPESTQNCAQQLVALKPLAVVGGVDFNQAAASSIFKDAGIPQIGGSPLLGPDYGATDSFYFAPGTPPTLANMALFAVQALHVKRVAIIYDNPSVQQGLSFVTGPLDKAGVAHIAVDASHDTQDYSAPFSALNAKHQDAIIAILGGSSSCIAFAQASASQQNTTPVITIAPCRGADVQTAVGGEEEGWYYTAGFEEPSANPSTKMKILLDKLNTYGHTKPVGLSTLAFASMMTFYSVLKDVGAGASPAAIAGYMRSQSGQIFTGPQWKCATMKAFPAICSAQELFYQVKGDSVVPAGDGNYLDATAALNG